MAVAACVPQPVMQEAAAEAVEQTLRLGMTSVGAGVQFGPMDTRLGVIVARFQYATPLTNLPDGSIAPELIERYESNEDATVYTLHVDPRAVWSDSTPLTASDIKASWEWMTDPANEVTFLSSLYLSGVVGWQEMADGEADEVAGLVVIDDKTLEVQLVATDQLFPFGLCRLFTQVFNVEDAAGDPDYFLKPYQLVNGPYQITEVHPSGSQAVFELNPNWWGDKPAISKIIMQAYTDQTAMGIAMENGQLDVAIFGNARIMKDTLSALGEPRYLTGLRALPMPRSKMVWNRWMTSTCARLSSTLSTMRPWSKWPARAPATSGARQAL